MKHTRLFLCALAVFILDRLAKVFWQSADFVLIPGVLAIRSTQNTGMAFGMLPGGTMFLIAASILLLIIALIWLLHKKELPRLVQWGAGLMGGGALGNLFDRIFYGHVIDMLDVIFLDFFIFNPADVGVVLGAALLGIYLLKGESAHT